MSLSVQFFSLLAMTGAGILAGAIMDFFGTVVTACDKRSWIRRRAIWLEWIVWILIGAGAFWVLLIVREGAWRMYDPLAQISGMLLYAAIFHYPFRFVGRLLLLLIIRPVWNILRLIYFILRRIIGAFVRILKWISWPIVHFGRKSGKFLQNKGRVLYNREQ